MSFTAGGGRKKQMAEINVTPFVDVVLVLLVIFMITAPMLQTGIKVNLPKATLDPIPTDTTPTVVSIALSKKIFLGDTEYSDGEVESKLIPVLQKKPNETIYLRADKSLAYGHVAKFVSRLHSGGIRTISLVTESD